MTDTAPASPIGTSGRTLLIAMRSGGLAAVVSMAVQIALLPFVLGRLGADAYGAWLTLAAVVGVGGLADAGIRTEVVRRVADAHGRRAPEEMADAVRTGVSLLAAITLPALVLGLLAAPAICVLLFPEAATSREREELVTILRLLLLVMAANLLLGTHFSALRGVQRSDVEAIGQVLGVVANALVTVVAVIAGLGLWALFLGYTAAAVVVLGVQWMYARRLLPGLRLRMGLVNRTAALAYLSLSGLALVSQVGDVVDSQWDKLVLSRYVGAEAVTAFHVGTSLLLQAKAVALLPLAPIMVAVAELGTSSLERARQLQKDLMKIGAIANSVLVGGAFVFLPSFIQLWLGVGYADAGQVARIFAFSVLLTLMAAPHALQAFAEGQHRVCALSALANMIVNAVVSLVLTMQIGLLGAAYGSLAGTVSGIVVFYVLARGRLAYWAMPPWRAVAVTALISTVVVTTGADDQDSWLGLLLIAAAFASVAGATGVLVERPPLPDRLRLSSIIRK